MHKPKLDIILGASYTFSDIEGLRALEESFDVTFHAFETPIIHHLSGAAQLKIYAVIDDMPSYMRGIEPELAQADAILALGNQNISSFQASRAAEARGIPFFVIVDEMREVTKEQYGHIFILQSEVLRTAHQVYPIAKTIRANLLAAGCVKSKVTAIPPIISSQRYRFDEARRKKFRSYLQMSPDQLLVQFHQPLRSGFQPRLAMEWLRYLRAEEPKLFTQVTLLYCKGGELSRALKTEALNHGLSAQVKFLDQDTSGFIRDLYSAGDLVMANTIPCEDHLIEVFPRWQLEAVAAGMVPLYPEASPVKKLIKKALHYRHDHDLDDLTKGLRAYCARRKVDAREVIASHQHNAVMLTLDQDKVLTAIGEDISAAIAATAPKKTASPAPKKPFTIIKNDAGPQQRYEEDYAHAYEAGDLVAALTSTEKLISLSQDDATQQAQYYYRKAQLQQELQDKCADPFTGGDLAEDRAKRAGPIEQTLEVCLGLDPNHGEARLALALSLYEGESFAEAVTVLTERPIDQRSVEQLDLLAKAQEASGDCAGAIVSYLALLRRGHNNQVMATRLCRLLAETPIGVDEKISALKQAVIIDGSIAMLRKHLVSAFLTAGILEEGKAWLEEQDAAAEHNRLLEDKAS